MSTAAAIVSVARSKVGKQDWMYAKAKDNFPANTNKCNQFVYDVMVEAGVKKVPTVSKYIFLSRCPTAGEWADVNRMIEGWVVVKDPQPGDVIAEAHNYSDATGHCGIVVAAGKTVSASSNVGGMIVENDWGFRPGNKPTFRRKS